MSISTRAGRIVCVTGASGYIASWLVKLFLNRCHRQELLDPSVKRTLNVPNACTKFATIKRVASTSSVAAVAYNGRPRTPDVVVDETWFSNPDFCREAKLWYAVSKTLAEDAAWKFTKEKGMDMVAINPAMLIGPQPQPTLNTSAAAVLSLIKLMEDIVWLVERVAHSQSEDFEGALS